MLLTVHRLEIKSSMNLKNKLNSSLLLKDAQQNFIEFTYINSALTDENYKLKQKYFIKEIGSCITKIIVLDII